jgi:starch synthase
MAAARKLRVLHVASEAVPLVKTGGLADVAGALPKALAAAGVDVRVVVPGYRSALRQAEKLGLTWLDRSLVIESAGVDHRIGIGSVRADGVTYYLLACNELYDRDGIYGPLPSHDYDDNPRRFAVFAKAALALPGLLKWKPHVVHAHDWQAGFVPALLQRGFLKDLPATRSVFSLHNVAYQGASWHFDLKLTGLDWALYNPMQVEHHGRLNPLKAGIVFADRVTTVSRTYAQEIQTPEFGFGLDPVIRHHAYKLSGITNGIDDETWDPARDPHLPATYNLQDLAGKSACKAALQRELGLPEDPGVCLVGIIARLVDQKGVDLVPSVVDPYILAGRMQLVVLGAGDGHLEQAFRNLQGRHPSRVCFWHGYNEGLSHRIEAGADLFLMPSRYEPCGLNQMYSLRYGTLPLVRFTGGLADTVRDISGSPQGNGFTFGPMDYGHLSSCLDRALGLYQHYPQQWRDAQRAAMSGAYGWDVAAAHYQELYRSLVEA